MKNNKILKFLLAAVVVLILFAVIGKKAGWFGKALTIKVAVESAEKRTIVEPITANGKIQPEKEVKISPDVSGEIVELTIKEGDSVEKGQLLLRIKPDIYISKEIDLWQKEARPRPAVLNQKISLLRQNCHLKETNNYLTNRLFQSLILSRLKQPIMWQKQNLMQQSLQ